MNDLEVIMGYKVAIYCRLSEEDRDKRNATDDSNSIQNQKAMLIQYVMEQSWELYNIYSDDDYTGADRRRPEFNRLLEDAKAHKFDIILCKTQSRFTRELELVEKYIHGLFPAWGIRFVSVVDNADTNNRGNKKSRQINGLINEWYLEDMSDNIRSVLVSRRKEGYHIGAFALYGYQKDPEKKGHLIIDEEAATVVREVFTLFSQGYGKTAIARILNDRGIPNPTEYKRLYGLRYKTHGGNTATLWKYSAIADMLINEIYIGNMVQGKYGSTSYKTKINKPRPKSEWYIVEGTHEPIIDRELWDRVQALIKEKARPFGTGTIGLFARKVRCANCGYVMRSSKSAPEKGGRHYLCCSNRHVSPDACIGSFVSVDRLERMVVQELNRLSAEYLDKDVATQNIEIQCNLQEQKERLKTEAASYRKKITEFSDGIQELYVDRGRGDLSEGDFIDILQGLKSKRERIKQMIVENERAMAEIERKIAIGDNRRELVEQYANIDHLTREMVEILIDYISVDRRIPGTRNVPIEIHWNF